MEIKKGLKNGTKIIFPRSGNKQVDGSICNTWRFLKRLNCIADLTFIVKEEVHPKFKRNGDDLVYDLSIPLEQALLGSTIQVPTLDGRILHVPMNEVVM